jgi:hypothetical protein
MSRTLKDVLAGLVFVGFGLAFAVLATGYDLGTPLQVGPGGFPLVLGSLLVLLGGLIAVKGTIEGAAEPIGVIPWRAVGLVIGSVVVFALTVRGLGVIPATFLTTLMAGFASVRAALLPTVAIGVGLTALSVLLFVVALGVRLPLIGPWLGG